MTSGGIGGGAALQGVVDRLEEEAKAQEQKAWQSFAKFCTEAGISSAGAEPGSGLSADLVVETGTEARRDRPFP